jgi:hypothetical protein
MGIFRPLIDKQDVEVSYVYVSELANKENGVQNKCKSSSKFTKKPNMLKISPKRFTTQI